MALRENAELGKRYDELAKMVDRCMGELEVENERLRAERDTANAAMFGWQNEAEWLRTTMEHALLLIDREHDTKAWDLINDVLEAR